MTVLTICQDAAPRVGLEAPTTLFTGADQTGQQMLALAQEELNDLMRYEWQCLRREATFTTLATEDQGAITTIAPNLKKIINDTIWNRALRRPVFGPLAPQRWQQQKAMSMQGPWNQFMIRNDRLLMIPAPAAGQACYFEYVTKAGVTDSVGNSKTRFTSDLDTVQLDEELVTLGVIWRFKAHKGFDYEEDKRKYDSLLMDAKAADGAADVLSLGDTRWDIYPGVVVPSGSWSVT